MNVDMRFEPFRLRRGEVISAAGAVALLALMFLVPWYGLTGPAERRAAALGAPVTVDGWNGLTVLRWLVLLSVITALSLFILQGTQRAPALPVTFSVITAVMGTVVVLTLLYRVLINVPGPDSRIEVKLGAYLGLLAACGLTYGAASSLRQEASPEGVGLNIRIVTLSQEGRAEPRAVE